MKRIVKYLLLSALLFQLAFSYADEASFFDDAIKKTEAAINEADSPAKQALLLQNLDQWLTLLARTQLSCAEKKSILQKAEQPIAQITEVSTELLSYLPPGKREAITQEVLYHGIPTTAYVNFLPDLFEEELRSYNNHGHFEKQQLTRETLSSLRSGTSYNFVVTLDGSFFYSELQEHEHTREGNVKVLLSPNHAILANGQPVVAAGELSVIGDASCKIYTIAISSGHYRPGWESKELAEQTLVELGIPQEQIVTSMFNFHVLPWKFVQKLA